MFPLGLEKREGIFQSGNFTQNTGKIRKITLENFKIYSKSQGNLSASNSENPKTRPQFKMYPGWPRYRENGIWMLTFPDRENTVNLINLIFYTGKILSIQQGVKSPTFSNFLKV